MESWAMSTAASAAGSGSSTNSRPITNFVDLTLSDDEEEPDNDEIEIGHNDEDNDSEDGYEEGSDQSDIIMLDFPPPVFGGPSNDSYVDPNAVLPPGIRWPEVLITGNHIPKCAIPRQFIKIITFSRRLNAHNPDIAFTIPQYKAAWVYAVYQCRGKVDLTATFEANPGLDEFSFTNLINSHFEIVLQQVETNGLKTRGEQLEYVQLRIQNAQDNTKELKRLRRQEQRIIDPKPAKHRLSKAEKGAARRAAESRSKMMETRSVLQHRPGGKQVNTERKPPRRGEVMQADGTWGTAANTVPLVRNRMNLTAADAHHPTSSPSVPHRSFRSTVPPPALIPASSWYSPSESRVSRNVVAEVDGGTVFTPFTPYTPSRFSQSNGGRTADSMSTPHHRSQEDLVRPENDLYRPQFNSFSPRTNIYDAPQPAIPTRPEADIYRPPHYTQSQPLIREPINYISQQKAKMEDMFGTIPPGTNVLDHAQASLAKLIEEVRVKKDEGKKRYAIEEERGAIGRNVERTRVMERERVQRENEKERARQEMLPEGRDEHMKYYVLK